MALNNENKNKLIFGLIVGTIYILFGVIQIIVSLGFGFGFTDAIYIPHDIIGGFILILIGTVFLFGVHELRAGTNEGVAYVYVGILLALIFMIIYILIMISNALEAYVLLNEDFEHWMPSDDLKPGIYLGLFSLIGLILWRNKFLIGSK